MLASRTTLALHMAHALDAGLAHGARPPVGAGLLASPICQLRKSWLTLLVRQQADYLRNPALSKMAPTHTH
jgi:hypothetical protein